jgi:hypothetical protein
MVLHFQRLAASSMSRSACKFARSRKIAPDRGYRQGTVAAPAAVVRALCPDEEAIIAATD